MWHAVLVARAPSTSILCCLKSGSDGIPASPGWFQGVWVSSALLLACFGERVMGSNIEEAFVLHL